MSRSVKAAVIGAGAGGLCAARELLREGHQVVIFEKADRLGGVWVYDPRVESDPLGIDPNRETVHSSLYRSLRTNLPRQLMSLLDYPFSRRENGDPRAFPSHEEVLWFLNKFADDFGLVELVRFNSEVVRVERVEEKKDQWTVEWRTRGSDSVSREVFEAVVVCVGHNSEPELTAVAGIEKWPGYQIHSHNYRVPEPFKGQIVVVIGYGPSGFEISREIATEAEQVHIATKIPNVQVKQLENHNNIWLHTMIEHVCEDGKVVFQDGSSVYADTILYCTGYKYHYPFLVTNGIVTAEENRVGPLLKHVFPPRLAPWLSFIGIANKDIGFPLMDIQSKWIARVLSGKVLLPNEEEMAASIEELYRQMEENGVPKRLTHIIYPNGIEYHSWICGQIGLPPQEWRWKMLAELIKIALINMNEGYRDEWDEAYWDSVIKDAAIQVIDIKTKWMARVYSGKVMLPNEEEMMASTKELYMKMEENGLPKCYTHVIKSNGIAYKNWLLAQIGLPPFEEWKVKVYDETVKNIRGMQDGYRDRLYDSFWEAFLKVSKLPVNGDEVKKPTVTETCSINMQ